MCDNLKHFFIVYIKYYFKFLLLPHHIFQTILSLLPTDLTCEHPNISTLEIKFPFKLLVSPNFILFFFIKFSSSIFVNFFNFCYNFNIASVLVLGWMIELCSLWYNKALLERKLSLLLIPLIKNIYFSKLNSVLFLMNKVFLNF